MSGYKTVNLQELEDVAPGFDLGDVQESRFATKALGCEQTGMAYYRIKPGRHPSWGHKHGRQEELYVVVSGSGRVKLDDEVRDFRQWDTFRVAPETVRSFEAGEDGAEVIAFGARIASNGEADHELVQDFWSD